MKSFPDIDRTESRSLRDEAEEPLRLSWIDPKSGEELAVEMWGSRAFADELVELGFEVRGAALDDEGASSLFVVIRQADDV
jgi:hypothetical protein